MEFTVIYAFREGTILFMEYFWDHTEALETRASGARRWRRLLSPRLFLAAPVPHQAESTHLNTRGEP